MKHLILIAVLLSGCTASYQGEKELGQINRTVTKRLATDCNLFLFGSGASWPDKCHAVAFDFLNQYSATLPEARKCIVNAAQEIMSAAHEVEGFEHHLANPPFTEQHIMLGIGFDKPSNEDKNSSLIDRVTMNYGIIRYKIWNEENYQYDTIHEETYEEALKLLAPRP